MATKLENSEDEHRLEIPDRCSVITIRGLSKETLKDLAALIATSFSAKPRVEEGNILVLDRGGSFDLTSRHKEFLREMVAARPGVEVSFDQAEE